MLNKKTLTEARVYLEKNILPIIEEEAEKAAESRVVSALSYEMTIRTNPERWDKQYINICCGFFTKGTSERKFACVDFYFGFADYDEQENEKALRKLKFAMMLLEHKEVELACKALKEEEK